MSASSDLSTDPDQRGGVVLPSRPGVRAVLDVPSGLVLVESGHLSAHGSPDDLERWAAELIAVAWAARSLSLAAL